MNKVIPLVGGSVNSHQQFDVQLGDNLVTITLLWKSILEQWSMDIDQEGVRLVSGAMLEPGCDIIATWQSDLGRLVLVGDEATLDNLGRSNSLIWIPPND